jgi:uncharacterized membrane protein
MSDLLAIVYPDEQTAMNVRDTLARLQRERLISLADAVVVTKRQDGRVELNQPSLAAAGAASGALWGTLIGMLFFAPLLGLAAGAAGGALSGKLSDYGIEDNFMKELGAQLQPGKAALFLLVRQVTPDKVLDAVKQYGGTVIRSSLTRDAEARLQQALNTGAMSQSMGAQDASAQI